MDDRQKISDICITTAPKEDFFIKMKNNIRYIRNFIRN